jgi:hypothetical protein
MMKSFERFILDVRPAARLRMLAVCSLSAMVFTGCVSATALPPQPELVAPLPGPDSELAYDVLTRPDSSTAIFVVYESNSGAGAG